MEIDPPWRRAGFERTELPLWHATGVCGRGGWDEAMAVSELPPPEPRPCPGTMRVGSPPEGPGAAPRGGKGVPGSPGAESRVSGSLPRLAECLSLQDRKEEARISGAEPWTWRRTPTGGARIALMLSELE